MKISKSLLIILPLFFIGCVNKKGVSLNYYPGCHEYYDYYGVYHEKCDNNIYNFDYKKDKKELPPVCLDCN
jgi:hypothetical protein